MRCAWHRTPATFHRKVADESNYLLIIVVKRGFYYNQNPQQFSFKHSYTMYISRRRQQTPPQPEDRKPDVGGPARRYGEHLW